MDKRNSLIQTSTHQSSIDWAAGKGVHSKQFFAVVRGVVEYNRDPHHRGRIMVRVLEDGPEFQIQKPKEPRRPTFDLGWCSPMMGVGSGAGFGSYTVPPVGARVFVMYERGDFSQPLYFGGWVANAPRQKRYGVTKTTLSPPLKEYPEDSGYSEEGAAGTEYDFKFPPKPTAYQGHWMEEQGPEIPLELLEMVDHTPDTQLYFKTLKGASLLVKERDEAEEMVLTDRLGAELRFESNVTSVELDEDNAGGVVRRGRVSATQHEPMSLDNLVNTNHSMSLTNAIRAGLEVEANIYGDDSLRLQVHPEQDIKKNVEVMPTRVAVELDEGEQRVRIIYIEQGENIGSITFDASSRALDIQGIERTRIFASEDIVLSSPKVRILGDIDIEGEIRHMGGKKFTFLDNDMEPYGSQTRNYWPFRESTNPYPYHDSKYDRGAATRSNERRWW
jgi:hypothetical protein